MYDKPATAIRPGDDVTRKGTVVRTVRQGRKVAITTESGDTFHVERTSMVSVNGDPEPGEPTASDPTGEETAPEPPTVATEDDVDHDTEDDDGEEE